jgi:pimeloyl-ACP methyl ester carboxylesterase
MIDARSSVITLGSGRAFGVAEYGRPDGPPLLYFHGIPGSRCAAAQLAPAAQAAGVRLIGIDRPGMGLSTFQEGRRVVDWPDDVSRFADALGIERFAVLGVSGGGPHALACAYKIPDRLTACGIVSGAAPLSPFTQFLFQSTYGLQLSLMRRWCSSSEGARKSLRLLQRILATPDRAVLADAEVSSVLAASFIEAFRQGIDGEKHDIAALFFRGWGFTLEKIDLPRLYWWHGGLDKSVPLRVAQWAVSQLRTCRAVYYPQEGHISIIVRHRDEIVATLTAP